MRGEVHALWNPPASLFTLGTQINIRVQLGIWGGHFGKNNKRTGPNKHTGWKKLAEVIIDVQPFL